jgi:tetratricopeptide (TPR) repeat protein
MHLSVDPWWECATVLAFGRTDDGLPRAQFAVLDEDPRIRFILDAPSRGPVIGFDAHAPHEIDVAALDSLQVWDGPRFHVPALGLTGASVGEVLLSIRARFAEGEPTADALHFHLAIGTAAEEGEAFTDFASVLAQWRLAIEAGNMKALFGLGYTLVEAGRPREAYDSLRRYTELTPRNAWAWCWLGKACHAMGETAEARAALRRAIACERAGSCETDARTLLEQLGG